MTVPMTAEQAFFDARLRARIARLKKLMDLNAPLSIVAAEFLLVEHALWGRAPKEMGEALTRHRQTTERTYAGLCTSCGVPLDAANVNAANDLCKSCVKDIIADDPHPGGGRCARRAAN